MLMKEKIENPSLSPNELKEFLGLIGTVAATSKIYSDGIQYVNDVGFWEWMAKDIIKKPGLFDSAHAIRSFGEIKPQGIKTLLQGRGMEWDFVRDVNNNPSNILKSARLGNIAEDRNGIDVVIRNLLGESEKIQIKSALSTGKRVNLSKYGDEITIKVNQKIAEYRKNNELLLKQRGDFKPVDQVYTDKQIEKATNSRLKKASSGKADPGFTSLGVLKQVGKGALIGAVINVGISSITNYSSYSIGEITGAEYGDLIIKESMKGAIIGGSFAAINIPMQIVAQSIGVGIPVTIPVMIIIGMGLNKIINPLFKEGEYQEILSEMNYSTNIIEGFREFALISSNSFESLKKFSLEMDRIKRDSHSLDIVNNLLDVELEKKINKN